MAPTITRITLFCLALMTLFTSCIKDQEDITARFYDPEDYEVIARSLNLPNEKISYEVNLAPHMEAIGMQAPQLSDTKALLGRVLFYDKKLSKNNAVSCASCHKQEIAFADDVAKSKGFDGQLTKRNSLALAATANFQSSYGDGSNSFINNGPGNSINGFSAAGFFWDERAFTIAEQSRLTIQDDIEMGMNLSELTKKLADVDYYQVLFRKAFGATTITEDRILEALQEFVNSFVSSGTRFDQGMNKHHFSFDNFENFSQQENLGKQIFNERCSSCHGADMSSQIERTAHNGLEILDGDLGVGGFTKRLDEEGKFKVPFLRNVALTGPYMHDGRFETLEEVVDHYSENIEMHPNLDFRLRDPDINNQPVRMNFTENEKRALVSFLHTLTDEELIYDERFGDPFMQ